MKFRYFLVALLLTAMVSCTTEGEVMNTDNEVIDADKLCALTFDDGPNTVKTALVLDKLEAYGVPASFFVVGTQVNSSTAEVMKRAVSMGCEINNHSWGWDSMNKMTADEISQSITKTTEAIETYAGVSPSFFRPPNLAISTLMNETIDLPFAGGITGNDWTAGVTAQQTADQILGSIQDGSIILLHDVQGRNPHPTPEALDIIIPELKKQGYEFVTLTELFERKGVDPKSKTTGMWSVVK